MAVIIVVIAIILIGSLLLFQTSLSKDNEELNNQPLEEKFFTIVKILNKSAFSDKGEITKLNKRSFNLYGNGENQIINFHYSTGSLTITWKYKYYQKEIIHKKTYNNMRNLSIFEQGEVANKFVEEMNKVIINHKKNVMGSHNNSIRDVKSTNDSQIKPYGLDLDLHSNRNDAINSLKRMAENMGCQPNQVKDNFTSSIEGLNADELELLIEQLENKEKEEAIHFNIEEEDTAASIMGIWAINLMGEKVNGTNTFLLKYPELARAVSQGKEATANFLRENPKIQKEYMDFLLSKDN